MFYKPARIYISLSLSLFKNCAIHFKNGPCLCLKKNLKK